MIEAEYNRSLSSVALFSRFVLPYALAPYSINLTTWVDYARSNDGYSSVGNQPFPGHRLGHVCFTFFCRRTVHFRKHTSDEAIVQKSVDHSFISTQCHADHARAMVVTLRHRAQRRPHGEHVAIRVFWQQLHEATSIHACMRHFRYAHCMLHHTYTYTYYVLYVRRTPYTTHAQ